MGVVGRYDKDVVVAINGDSLKEEVERERTSEWADLPTGSDLQDGSLQMRGNRSVEGFGGDKKIPVLVEPQPSRTIEIGQGGALASRRIVLEDRAAEIL